jgi:hypothetical protein
MPEMVARGYAKGSPPGPWRREHARRTRSAVDPADLLCAVDRVLHRALFIAAVVPAAIG